MRLAEVEVLADRLVMIVGGRVVAQGSTQELLGADGRLEDLFLRPAPGCSPPWC